MNVEMEETEKNWYKVRGKVNDNYVSFLFAIML